jgi:hypothetical protein
MVNCVLWQMGLDPSKLEWDIARIRLEDKLGVKRPVLSADQLNKEFDEIIEHIERFCKD